MRTPVKAIWREKRSSPGWWRASCGAGDGCGQRLAQAVQHPYRVRRWVEPGFVVGSDGYYRRSGKYRIHYPFRSREPKNWKWLQEGMADPFSSKEEPPLSIRGRYISPIRQRQEEGSHAARRRAGVKLLEEYEVGLPGAEGPVIAYVICPNPKCQALNAVGPLPS